MRWPESGTASRMIVLSSGGYSRPKTGLNVSELLVMPDFSHSSDQFSRLLLF